MDNCHDISAEAVALIRQPLRAEIDRLRAQLERISRLCGAGHKIGWYAAVCEIRDDVRAALAATAPAPASDGWRETAKTLPPVGEWVFAHHSTFGVGFAYHWGEWTFADGPQQACDDEVRRWQPLSDHGPNWATQPLPAAPCAESLGKRVIRLETTPRTSAETPGEPR